MELKTPVKAYNIDGTENKKGTIKNYVDLQFSLNGKEFQERFYVTGLGKQRVILGLPWLRKHNPEIDWQTGKLEWLLRLRMFNHECQQSLQDLFDFGEHKG